MELHVKPEILMYLYGPTFGNAESRLFLFSEHSGVPRIFFFRGGVQQIQLRAERMGIWGAAAPQSGVPLNLQTNETHILITLLWMYIPRNW
jgi:hypothetical protein